MNNIQFNIDLDAEINNKQVIALFGEFLVKIGGLGKLIKTANVPVSSEFSPKTEQVKAEQVKAEQVKAEQVKAEQVKAEQVKAEQVKAEQVKAEQVKAENGEPAITMESLRAKGLEKGKANPANKTLIQKWLSDQGAKGVANLDQSKYPEFDTYLDTLK